MVNKALLNRNISKFKLLQKVYRNLTNVVFNKMKFWYCLNYLLKFENFEGFT